MKLIFASICFSVLFCGQCVAQEKAKADIVETQLANDLNRIQSFFNIAQNNIIGNASVDPSEDQIKLFKELQTERESVQTLITEAVSIVDLNERLVALQAVNESMRGLHEKLTSEILLPHQVMILNQKEFASLLRKHGGNFEAVIEEHYGDTFGMSEKQSKRFKEIRKDQSDKKRSAANEYSKKLQEIDNEAKQKLASLFTPIQIEKIKKLSGVDLSATKM